MVFVEFISIFLFPFLWGKKSKVYNMCNSRIHAVNIFQAPVLGPGGEAAPKTEAGHAVVELRVGS